MREKMVLVNSEEDKGDQNTKWPQLLYGWNKAGLLLYSTRSHTGGTYSTPVKSIMSGWKAMGWLGHVAVGGNTIFVLGPRSAMERDYRYLFEIRIVGPRIVFEEKAVCPNQHYECGCIAIQGEVYMIGGYNAGDRIMGKCDHYSVLRDKWTPLPSLNVPRVAMGVCAVNSRYVYAFSGFRENVDRSVEKFDALDEDAGWTLISPIVRDTRTVWCRAARLCAAQISADRILVFGSMAKSTGTYEWDLTDENVKRGGNDMVESADLDCRNPVWTEGGWLGVIDWEGRVHHYSAVLQVWRLVTSSTKPLCPPVEFGLR